MLGNKNLGKAQGIKLAGFKDWSWVNGDVPKHGELQRQFHTNFKIYF